MAPHSGSIRLYGRHSISMTSNELQAQIDQLEDALASTSSDRNQEPAFRAVQYDRLSDLHYSLYEITRDRGDFEAARSSSLSAARIGARATQAPPPGHSNSAQWWALQGSRQNTRYERFNDSHDLDDAIKSYEEALAALPTDSSLRGALLMNQANCLCTRYETGGRSADIEKAIRRGRSSLRGGGSNTVIILNDLSTMHLSRYEREGDSEDLHEAVSLARRAVDHTAREDPKMATRLMNLANGLCLLFESEECPRDISEAIHCLRRAERRYPESDPGRRAQVLSKLARAYYTRYSATRTSADLRAAISKAREALRLGRAAGRDVVHPDIHRSLTRLLRTCREEARDLESETGGDVPVEA